jgi:hypothetical protein
MTKFVIQSQYFFANFRLGDFGRNKTSSGTSWFGYDSWNRRLNLWPVSIWLLPYKKMDE